MKIFFTGRRASSERADERPVARADELPRISPDLAVVPALRQEAVPPAEQADREEGDARR